jgi:multidrug resistance protein
MSSLTESQGRRPVYMLCLLIYIAANIGMALQRSYVGLLALRCLQSTGSSAMVLLGTSVIADVSTSAERGKYYSIGFTATVLGPAVAPVLGGVLTQYVGWQSVFVFLVVVAGAVLFVIVLFYPETSRQIVGNGSRTPQPWNVPAWQLAASSLREKEISRQQPQLEESKAATPRPTKLSNPLRSLLLLFDKHTGFILFYTGLAYAAFNFVISGLQALLVSIYGLNELQVGLSYIPIGVGAMLSAAVLSRLVDWNYRRLAVKHEFPVTYTRQLKFGGFPIEKARLQIALPMVWAASAAVLAYGWVLHRGVHLAGPLVLLVVIGFANTGTVNIMTTLALDVYPRHKTTVSGVAAATNLVKCMFGAAASAFVLPLVEAVGTGWAHTLMGLVWALASLLLILPIAKGPKYRVQEEGEEGQQETTILNEE